MAAPAEPKQAKTPKKTVKKTPSDHPSYDVMIVQAIKALNDKKGSSRQAIVKYIKSNNKVPEKCETRITLALKRMEKKGALGHTKGSGASGSFRVNEAKKPAKKPAKKVKKVKKPAPAKKSATPKSPKKAKSPAKKSKPKKKTAAKKAQKPAAKKAAPAAKKAPKTKKATPKKKTSKKGKKQDKK